jgi:hypothetical protein
MPARSETQATVCRVISGGRSGPRGRASGPAQEAQAVAGEALETGGPALHERFRLLSQVSFTLRSRRGRGPRPRKACGRGAASTSAQPTFPSQGRPGGRVKRVAHRAALGDVARARCSSSRTGTTHSQCCRWWRDREGRTPRPTVCGGACHPGTRWPGPSRWTRLAGGPSLAP